MTPPDDALDTLDALTQERAYHEVCRAALAAMVEGADEQVVIGEDVSASGADAEVLGYALRSQAKELRELPEGPLFFGRLDFTAAASAGDHAGQRYHIGRLRITEDPSAPPLVVDWRAPVSRAFYQASPRAPQGVSVRRRFGWAPASTGASADLTGLEDERLDQRLDQRLDGRFDERPGAARLGPAAPGTLLAREIERPRIGPMRDIAATIQPEQDDLVRGDLTASVCVQGAPGTGKTAVGLHRAAYLLYTHPQRFRRAGLLVLGPNRTFLRYISEVLPALGETGVRQATVEDEIARQPVTAEDTEAAAVVKHDARMAEVLYRALYARVGTDIRDTTVGDDLSVADGSYRWRVPGDVLDGIVAEVRAELLPYGTGRERVRTRVVARLRARAERRAGPQNGAWVRRIGASRPVTAYLDAVWPRVRPEEVVAEVLSDPGTLARAADRILGPDERAALLWARPPRSYKSARWSAADLVLLDEVAGLLEHPGGYGHIVVDEAQDLSPMQCRAIARRARYGSLTVLGDLAQATAPWAVRDWAELLGHLGRPEVPVVPLTTGFRVPATLVEFANRLLAELDVDVPPGRSLRRDGELRVREVADVLAGSVCAVRDALGFEGSVGVIAADAQVDRVRGALAEAGIEAGRIGAGGVGQLGFRVTVLPASLAKGLEYDHVVAVEPAAVAEAEPRGAHRLYVVLTRAVSRLDVVHSRPLPFGA
ncbi:HelD family protein [Streptomyces sp. NPDC091292]|uniref:HelD family protein n=1 Tax=Streptomyces sp. NPDC091292 TaxID=3365991 RepID=UPI003819CF0F